MFIALLLLIVNLHSTDGQANRSICSFASNIYFSNAAVANQFQLINRTSLSLTASYAHLPSFRSTFDLGLIYRFSPNNSLVPFPIVFDCASQVLSCQLKIMTTTNNPSDHAESIRVRLTSLNFTNGRTSNVWNQMSLYLKQGRYQLSNCSLDDGQAMTDAQTIFHIDIQYEKPLGTPCNPTSDTCGSSALTSCSSMSAKCTCRVPASTPVSFAEGFYCADTLNSSNCQIFPSRCVSWCNGTTNALCMCPSDTLKISRNNLFVCELPIHATNCSIDDDLRRCSMGQCCIQDQCIDCVQGVGTTSVSARTNNDSFDERLRVALGVVAGLLGLSAVMLFSVLCWLRRRQKQMDRSREKSFSPTTSSSTSSLYISPIQPVPTQRSSVSTLDQLSPSILEQENPTMKVYRTDSFRRAVQSTISESTKQLVEHVSNQRDSFISQKDGWSSPSFSTLDFVIPPESAEQTKKNVYQIIIPSSTPVLTHAV